MPRAVAVSEARGGEALTVVDLPVVNAGRSQVRLRNLAAAVNPVDVATTGGLRGRANAGKGDTESLPRVPGMDAAGIVDQVGEDVTTGVKVGDRVMAMVVPGVAHGGYSEQIVLEQGAVVPAPAGTTHVEAATLPMNALTARLSLDLMGLSAGQSLAVTGGPGAYGGYVIQLAKTDGLVVIGAKIMNFVLQTRSFVSKSHKNEEIGIKTRIFA